MALRALHFLDENQDLFTVFSRDRKCCAAVSSQRRVAVLHGVLDILRVMVHAADDDDILNSAGHIEDAVVIEKPEVTGSQPARVTFAGNPCTEARYRRVSVLPVALGDIGSRDPDSPDAVWLEPLAPVWVDDRKPLPTKAATAANDAGTVLVLGWWGDLVAF